MGLLGGLGVGIGAFAIKQFIGGQMQAIDATGKLAGRLGITTEHLAGLQHAASLADVATEDLTGSLEKMLRNLSVAEERGGATAIALRRIGLNTRALINAGPDAAFKSIADGIKSIEDPYKRAAVAQDIFGKGGQKLLPLLLDGASGIEAAQREAERLGLTFSQLDFQRVQDANDELTRTKAAFRGLALEAAITLAPALTTISNGLTKLLQAGRAVSNFFSSTAEDVRRVAHHMFQSARQAGEAARQMQKVVSTWNQQQVTDAFNAVAKEREDSLQSLLDGLIDQRRELTLTEREMLNYNLQMRGATAQQKAWANAIFDQIEAIKNAGKAAEEAAAIRESLDDFFSFQDDAVERRENRFAAAQERRFTFTTPDTRSAKDPTRIAETHLKTTEKALVQETKQTAILDLIKQKLAGGTIGVITSLN